MKRNELFDKCVANVAPDVRASMEKAMTCKWYRGGDCGKGTEGTPCEVKGCVAWYPADWYNENKK